MSSEDKNSIVFVSAFLVTILLIFIANRLVFLINPFYVSLIFLAVMYLFVVPRFVIKYHNMYNVEVPLFSLVPLLGESVFFSKGYNIAIYTFLSLSLLSMLLIKVPLNYLIWIFGEDKVIYSSNYFLVFSILFLLISFVIRGFAFKEVKRDVTDIRNHVILESARPRFQDKIMYFLGYFPVVRCLSIAQLTDSICILLNFHKQDVFEYLYSRDVEYDDEDDEYDDDEYNDEDEFE